MTECDNFESNILFQARSKRVAVVDGGKCVNGTVEVRGRNEGTKKRRKG